MTSVSHNCRRSLAAALGVILVWLVATAWDAEQWPSYLAQAAIFLTVGVIATVASIGKIDPPFRWTLIPFLAASCWAAFQSSSGVSIYPYATWTAALQWAMCAGVLWIAIYLFTDTDLPRQFRAAAVVFGVILALEATLQKSALNPRSATDAQTAMGPFLNYDHYAAFVELLLPIALWNAWRARTGVLIWLGAAAVLYGSVIASASRAGSALATLEAAIMLPFIFRHKTRDERRKALTFALAGAALLVIATLVVGSQTLLNRFAENDPLAFRRRMLTVAVRIIRARPWTGFGFGTWSTIYPRYADYDELAFVNHAHNDWAEWAGDAGLPFTLVMALVAVRAAWLCRRAPWGIGIVSVFAHSLVDFPLQRPAVMAWLVGLLGCLEATQCQASVACPPTTRREFLGTRTARQKTAAQPSKRKTRTVPHEMSLPTPGTLARPPHS